MVYIIEKVISSILFGHIMRLTNYWYMVILGKFCFTKQ